MKVAYVIPTHFDESSVMAGAERYSYGLAKAMAKRCETTLITFSNVNRTCQEGGLTVRYYKTLFHVGGIANPVSLSFLKDLMEADVIHCLQFRTMVTELSVLFGSLIKKKVFVTDLAGSQKYALSSLFPVWKTVRSFLLISEYNRNLQPKLPLNIDIIYGGVDEKFFSPGDDPKKKSLLYVGRIFPLKGIHDLIEALPSEMNLDIVGQSHDDRYLSRLKDMAVGKKITFYDDLSDVDLVQKYRESLATVLPSLVDGGFTTSMESLACGTPVIGTEVGSLPEIVENGVSGWLVPPNDSMALREKMAYLAARPDVALVMGRAGRQRVLERFTWDSVVERCLKNYGMAP